ncbi:MAG: PA14 domain-containing protein [Vicinamibacterales bacterium]
MTRVWILVGVSILCVAGALLWAGTRFGEHPPAWRAEFFGNTDLQGEPLASIRYSEIDFDWGDASPLPAVPIDAFSARLDTCLMLRVPARVTFHLSSDDGARLYVNGTALIDNWGIHAWSTKSGNTLLTPGRHHLRIDYFDEGGGAALYLSANPPILDSRNLVAPGGSLTSSNACRIAR